MTYLAAAYLIGWAQLMLAAWRTGAHSWRADVMLTITIAAWPIFTATGLVRMFADWCEQNVVKRDDE